MTFYVSAQNSVPSVVNSIYNKGNEIAIHTVTHSTGSGVSHDGWYGEIIGDKNWLHDTAGIPLNDI